MGRFLRVFSSSLALALSIASLIITIIIGYPQNLAKNGVSPYQGLALIDTSGITTRAGDKTYKGLPDSNDYSRHKDFFALYIHVYCSGHKDGDQYVVDFCSSIGSVFDQYRVWKVWGVDLGSPDKDEENALQETIGAGDVKTMPRVILGWFLASAALGGLTLVSGFFALCTTRAKGVAVFLGSVGTLCALVTAVLAQILFPTMVKRMDGYEVRHGNTSGKLTAILGIRVLTGLWIMAAFNLLATLFLAGALHSERKAQAAKREKRIAPEKDSRLKEYQLSPTLGKTPQITTRDASPHIVPGIIRRATGKFFGAAGLSRYDDTSYETLRVAGAGDARGRSRSRDPSRSRGGSPDGEKSVDTVIAPSPEERASRYEPFRHHGSV